MEARATSRAPCTCPAATSSRGSSRPRPDRSRALVLYCAGGSRSAFAAKTLEELGYENVASLAGGFTDWKRNGFPVAAAARRSTRRSAQRYSRHLLIPEVGRDRPDEAARLARPADRRRRPRLARRALPRRRRRRHARDRRRRPRRRVEPPAPDRPLDGDARRLEGRVGEADDRGAQPRRRGDPVPRAAHLRERRADPRRRLGRDRRRRRQLPDPLPRQRRGRLARHPARPRLDLPLRGPGHRLQAARGPVLPLPLPARRRRRSSLRAAPRAACSASCPGSSARSRRARR